MYTHYKRNRTRRRRKSLDKNHCRSQYESSNAFLSPIRCPILSHPPSFLHVSSAELSPHTHTCMYVNPSPCNPQRKVRPSTHVPFCGKSSLVFCMLGPHVILHSPEELPSVVYYHPTFFGAYPPPPHAHAP